MIILSIQRSKAHALSIRQDCVGVMTDGGLETYQKKQTHICHYISML